MEILMAILIGLLFTGGVYLLLRRSIFKLILGIILLSHAANLVLFISAGLERNKPPFIENGALLPDPNIADPLPQALILTAIVIGFGFTAFALVLIYRFYKTSGTVDFDEMKEE